MLVPNVSASTFHPAQDVGATFAAVNPPMSMQPSVGQPGESVSPHPSDWRSQRVYGVVTIVNEHWVPGTPVAVPPSITKGMGMDLSATFAKTYNASRSAEQKRRWAVVSNRGTVVILSAVPDELRPTDHSDFPPCVQGGMTYDEAELLANESNAPRYAMARVPRQWSIAVRRADSLEGGDA